MVGLALGLAALVGILIGVVLFNQVGPFPLLTSGPSTGTSSPPDNSGSTTPEVPSPGAVTPSPDESPSDDSDPSDAPFTKLALLQPENFDQHNWKSTKVLDTWEEEPSTQITSCTDLPIKGKQPIAVYAARYEGRVTIAAEIVARYPTEKAAKAAVERLTNQIKECDDRAETEPELTTKKVSEPDATQDIDVTIWSTSSDDDSTLGVVGIARAGDRLALLSLVSPGPGSAEVVDPRDTTYVDALYVYAGRRLI